MSRVSMEPPILMVSSYIFRNDTNKARAHAVASSKRSNRSAALLCSRRPLRQLRYCGKSEQVLRLQLVSFVGDDAEKVNAAVFRAATGQCAGAEKDDPGVGGRRKTKMYQSTSDLTVIRPPKPRGVGA